MAGIDGPVVPTMWDRARLRQGSSGAWLGGWGVVRGGAPCSAPATSGQQWPPGGVQGWGWPLTLETRSLPWLGSLGLPVGKGVEASSTLHRAQLQS